MSYREPSIECLTSGCNHPEWMHDEGLGCGAEHCQCSLFRAYLDESDPDAAEDAEDDTNT